MVTLSQINSVEDSWAEQEQKYFDIDFDKGNEHEESMCKLVLKIHGMSKQPFSTILLQETDFYTETLT
jgi:hypothetical protein